MPIENPQSSAALNIPEPESFIGTTGEHPPPIWREGNGMNLTGVTLEPPKFLPVAYVPHADDPILTSCYRAQAVGGKCNRSGFARAYE
jgi:hypothetical protein